jgi:uncharacterized protein YndB with AHSA1/START domain
MMPERLFSYRFGNGGVDTVTTWHLAPEGSGTRLTLLHEGFNVETPTGRQAFEGMKQGWPGVLARLETAISQ